MRLLAGVVAVVAAIVGLGAWLEVRSAATSIGFVSESGTGAEEVALDITLAAFDPRFDVMTGRAVLSLTPRGMMPPDSAGVEEDVAAAGSGYLVWLSRFTEVEGSPAMLRVSEGATPVVPVRGFGGVAQGTTEVRVNLTPVVATFWYPFDSYLLRVTPDIARPDPAQPGVATLLSVDRFAIDFATTGLWIDSGPAVTGPGGTVEVGAMIRRPLALQVIAGVMAGLACLWLWWLAAHAAVETHVAQLVGFFVGVWGWRKTLDAGAGLYPLMSDYLVIGASIAAVTIVLVRWFTLPAAPPVRPCPECLTPIPAAARRCASCGTAVGPAA